MIKLLLKKFGITDFGILELFFAFYLILSGYQYGRVPISLLALLFIDILALIRGPKSKFESKIIVLLFVYFILHDLLWWMIIPEHPSYMISNIIGNTIGLVSIFIIVPALDPRKLISMLYFVAILSCVGLVYHLVLISQGIMVTPIKLPFMPDMVQTSRLFEEGWRPKSFYWEPAACATFLMVPCFISLIEKRFVITAIIVVSMFISTSSLGIIMSSFLLATYALMNSKNKLFSIVTFMLLFIMGYLFFYTDMFEFARDKIMTTEFDENARLSNGPLLIIRTPIIDLILGVVHGNAFDYVTHTQISTVGLQIDDDSMYVPSFWNICLLYGIIGLYLYLKSYFSFAKANKLLIPYICALVISTFVQSAFIGATFVFQVICLSSLKNIKIKEE